MKWNFYKIYGFLETEKGLHKGRRNHYNLEDNFENCLISSRMLEGKEDKGIDSVDNTKYSAVNL